MSDKKSLVFTIIFVFLILFIMEGALRAVSFTKNSFKKYSKDKEMQYSDCEKKLLKEEAQKSKPWRYNHPVEGNIEISREFYIVEKDRYYKLKPNSSRLVLGNERLSQVNLVLDEAVSELLKDFEGEVYYKNYDNLGSRKTGREKGSSETEADVSVVILGDSFTEGAYVNDEDTFSAYLEKYAEQDGLGVRVSNMGVPSHTSKEEYFMLIDLMPYRKFDIVILNHFPNDININEHKVMGYWEPKEPQGKFAKWIFDNVFVARIIMEGWFSLFSKPLNPAEDKQIQKGWERSFFYLSKIKEVCDKNKILFSLSPIPPKEQFEFDNQQFYQGKLRDFCREKGILFLNPYDSFKQRGINEVYLDWDPHFTKEGHRIYAKYLYNEIKPYLKNP